VLYYSHSKPTSKPRSKQNVLALRQALQEKAAARVAKYPQYVGHFDGYKIVRILKQIKTKSGIAFDKDEFAIARPVIEHFTRPSGTKGKGITIWSMKLGWDVNALRKGCRHC
jgi:hypothetical protein